MPYYYTYYSNRLCNGDEVVMRPVMGLGGGMWLVVYHDSKDIRSYMARVQRH